MVVDEGKPLNRGEGPTVRIVMTYEEARRIRDGLAEIKNDDVLLGDDLRGLLRALRSLPLASSSPADVEPDHECQ